MKHKIKVNYKSFYEGLIKSAKNKDLDLGDIEIEGELVEDDYKFSIGDLVFVKPYIDTKTYEWNKVRKIRGNYWGKITYTNKNSPTKLEEGKMYVVKHPTHIVGDWENEEDLEIITL